MNKTVKKQMGREVFRCCVQIISKTWLFWEETLLTDNLLPIAIFLTERSEDTRKNKLLILCMLSRRDWK